MKKPGVINKIVGKKPWKVWKGIGSFLLFEFGPKVTSNPGKQLHGSYTLWIYMAHWQVRRKGKVIAHSESPDQVIKRAAKALVGKRLCWVVLEKNAVVTGMDMRNAQAGRSQYGGTNWEIDFQLTPGGATRFGDATGKHVGDNLAIVMNNEVRSAPTINSQITDRGQITGGFTQQSAEDLALILRSGALPATTASAISTVRPSRRSCATEASTACR